MQTKNIFLLLCSSFVILFLFISTVDAAVISGSVYDDSLAKLNDVVIKVNSNPAQQYISKDGSYQFELPFGDYTIDAQYSENKLVKYSAKENISITKEGNYKLDLILFSNLEEDTTSDLDLDLSLTGIDGNSFSIVKVLILLFVILLFLAILYTVYRYRKILKNGTIDTALDKFEEEQSDGKQTEKQSDEKGKKNQINMDDEQVQLLKLLKEHKRITQKEIRQEIPLSEAKISLMIAELEHKGVVEKIKKGRGNIIIYRG